MKKPFTPKLAIDTFLSGMADFYEKTFEQWRKRLYEALTTLGTGEDEAQRIVDSQRLKLVYMATICASEARGIKNCFEADVAMILLRELEAELKRIYASADDVSGWAFAMLGNSERGLQDNPPRVNELTFTMMKLLGLGRSLETERLFNSPIFVLMLEDALPIWGFWKQFSNNVVIHARPSHKWSKWDWVTIGIGVVALALLVAYWTYPVSVDS